MTPFLQKIVLIVLAGLCAVVLWQQVLLSAKPTAVPDDRKKLIALQHAYDSVSRHEQFLVIAIDSVEKRIDFLSRERGIYQHQAAAARLRLQKTIDEYAHLTRYDSLSVRDIRRYLSDSLP